MTVGTCMVVWSTGVCGKPVRAVPLRWTVDGVQRERDVCDDCFEHFHEQLEPFNEGARVLGVSQYIDPHGNVWKPAEVRWFLNSAKINEAVRGRLGPNDTAAWARHARENPDLHEIVVQAMAEERAVAAGRAEAERDPVLREEILARALAARKRKSEG